MVPKEGLFGIERSVPHGHVEAVLGTIRRLGIEDVIASKRCRERDLVVAMIIQRLIAPCSKLATTREWHDTTLGEELEVLDASEDDLYAALDWLRQRQERIETKLAKKHLHEGAVVLYDLTSSTYYGRTCPLATWGNNRDGTRQPASHTGCWRTGTVDRFRWMCMRGTRGTRRRYRTNWTNCARGLVYRGWSWWATVGC